ncbi:MAG: VanZ family protein [Moraxellaceae bacterium]|nr:VanZ family protein [Moraxellaceae bacterium]MDZ4386016.1 VanZ family protein [Moraxellaceae bacterium]
MRVLFTRSMFWTAVAVVLVLLLMPMTGNPNPGIKHLDKMVHTMLFFGVALIGFRVWRHQQVRIFAGLCVLAVLTEVLQGLTNWRTASPADALADVTGVTLAWVYCRIV